MTKKIQMPIAEYLKQQIALSGVPQTEIAEKLGYDKPNIITMFKQGRTKIPLNKIAPLAKILGIDPLHMLRMAMVEYSPETWEVLESMIGQRMITDEEQRILNVIRAATANYPVPMNQDREEQVAALFGAWAKHEYSVGKTAFDAAAKRKSNEEQLPDPIFGLTSVPNKD